MILSLGIVSNLNYTRMIGTSGGIFFFVSFSFKFLNVVVIVCMPVEANLTLLHYVNVREIGRAHV